MKMQQSSRAGLRSLLKSQVLLGEPVSVFTRISLTRCEKSKQAVRPQGWFLGSGKVIGNGNQGEG